MPLLSGEKIYWPHRLQQLLLHREPERYNFPILLLNVTTFGDSLKLFGSFVIDIKSKPITLHGLKDVS